MSQDSILAQAQRAVTGKEVPGVAIARIDAGRAPRIAAFGRADLGTGRVLRAHNVFQAASIGKLVTACAILRLVEAGALDLDEAVPRRVTRWKFPATPHDLGGVTLRRVLCHSAGLSLPDYPGFDPGAAMPTIEQSLSGATNGGGDLQLAAPPGGAFLYSGGGFTLLQLLIEEITGEAFAEHIRRTIFAPLGMVQSGFTSDDALAAQAATGHDRYGRPVPFFRFDGLAAAGMLTTAGDLSRYLAALIAAHDGSEGGIVSPAALRLITTPLAQTGRVDGLWAGYGLGCEIDERADRRRIIGHHGMNRGWRAIAAAELARGRALVLLSNGDAALPALEAVYEAWAGEA